MRLRLVGVGFYALLLFVPTHAQALPVKFLAPARVGRVCFDTGNTNAALDCWLGEHPDVSDSLYYEDSSYHGSWPTWPTAVKTQLHLYFNQMVLWYKAGMPPNFPHPFPVPVPPGGPRQRPGPEPDLAEEFWMTEAIGKSVYLSQAGSALAAELTAAFPWSITTYAPDQLRMLISMNDSMFYKSTVPSPGYFFQSGAASPATPGFTLTFFKSNGLIGTDAADTIGRLFAWERNLFHFFVVTGDPTTNIYPYFWGPNAPPVPDSMVIKGTTYMGPNLSLFGHFTAGCSGTMAFMKSALRSMNIPVQRNTVSCGHAAPIFPTVDLALTHGDDPYNTLGVISSFPGFPAPAPIEYFVTINDLNQLFPANQSDDACSMNVGIQVAKLAIQYGSDLLMTAYCQDLASGADHAGGKVFDYMKFYYPSVQTLETMGLWTTLENKVTATNFCGM